MGKEYKYPFETTKPNVEKDYLCDLKAIKDQAVVNCGFHQIKANHCDWRDSNPEREERARDKAKPMANWLITRKYN